MSDKIPCPICKGTNTKKHTKSKAGTPKVYCKDCKKARTVGGRPRGGQRIDEPKTRAEIQADYRRRHGLTGNEHRKKKGRS